MPANVVKSKADEKIWSKAKISARKMGKSGDFKYITGIYEKMKGDKEKSTKPKH